MKLTNEWRMLNAVHTQGWTDLKVEIVIKMFLIFLVCPINLQMDIATLVYHAWEWHPQNWILNKKHATYVTNLVWLFFENVKFAQDTLQKFIQNCNIPLILTSTFSIYMKSVVNCIIIVTQIIIKNHCSKIHQVSFDIL